MAVHTIEEPDPTPVHEFNLDDFTAAETAIAERKAGISIMSLSDVNQPKSNMLGALGWVLAKRTDPRLTYDAYMGSRSLTAIMTELGMADDDDDDENEEALGKEDAEST